MIMNVTTDVALNKIIEGCVKVRRMLKMPQWTS